MNLKSFLDRTRSSISWLAELGGISVPAAYTWLSGKASPKHETIAKLLLNGCRIDEIFDEQVLEAVRKTHAEDFPGIDMQLSPENCQKIVKAGLAFLKAQGDDPTISVK